jgi:cytochrome c-type biogenesis protein CcmF
MHSTPIYRLSNNSFVRAQMETEELFLIFAGLLLFFDLIQLSKAKPRDKRKQEYGFYAATLAFGLIIVSYLMFIQAFVSNDFSMKEVYSYSSSSLPAFSKLYATWGGASGSLLFLISLIGFAYFAYRFKTYEKSSSYSNTMTMTLNVILVFFLILTIMRNPFVRLSEIPLDGMGLNPQLQTFWMIIHPPIVFSGYVFVVLSFALVVANMKTGEMREDKLFRLSLQAAWLFLTVGIALGGMWAYEALGWGGYWSWDPVETTSLLPWLALTAYFHLKPLTKSNKSLAKETMILLAFVSLIFLSALTRGGLLQSVHAYALSPAGPFLLLFGLGVILYFLYLKRNTKKPLLRLDVDRKSLYSVSFLIGFFSLIFIFLVCFFGVAFPMVHGLFTADPLTPSIDFYNTWNFPFVMAFVAALVGCSLYEGSGFKSFTISIVGALSVGVLLVQLKLPTPNPLANLGFPLLVLALLAVVYRLVRILPKDKRSWALFGRSLIHLGVIIILLGVFVSATTKQVAEVNAVSPNTRTEALGVSIDLKNVTVYTGTGTVQIGDYLYPETSALEVDCVVSQGRDSYSTKLWIRLYAAYWIASQPTIIHTITGDLYLHLLPNNSTITALTDALFGEENPPDVLAFTVETIPMVYLVWLGVAFLTAGISAQLVRTLTETKRRNI